MPKPTTRIPMQHPTRKGQDGKPIIQLINPKTVRSGKAAKLGYIPIDQPEKSPHVESAKTTKPHITPSPVKLTK